MSSGQGDGNSGDLPQPNDGTSSTQPFTEDSAYRRRLAETHAAPSFSSPSARHAHEHEHENKPEIARRPETVISEPLDLASLSLDQTKGIVQPGVRAVAYVHRAEIALDNATQDARDARLYASRHDQENNTMTVSHGDWLKFRLFYDCDTDAAVLYNLSDGPLALRRRTRAPPAAGGGAAADTDAEGGGASSEQLGPRRQVPRFGTAQLRAEVCWAVFDWRDAAVLDLVLRKRDFGASISDAPPVLTSVAGAKRTDYDDDAGMQTRRRVAAAAATTTPAAAGDAGAAAAAGAAIAVKKRRRGEDGSAAEVTISPSDRSDQPGEALVLPLPEVSARVRQPAPPARGMASLIPNQTLHLRTQQGPDGAMLEEYTLRKLNNLKRDGSVFRAVHSGIDTATADSSEGRLVVVKVFRSVAGAEPIRWKMERWQQERDVHSSLDHRSIARLVSADARLLALFVEHVDARDLAQQRDGDNLFRGSTADARRIFGDVAAALAYLHGAKGLLHNDVKPANILYRPVGPRGAVLCDFGLSTRHRFHRDPDPGGDGDGDGDGDGSDDNDNDNDNDHSSRLPYYAGTPWYLASERVAQQPPSPASDVWALGVTMLFVLRLLPLPETSGRYGFTIDHLRRDGTPEQAGALRVFDGWLRVLRSHVAAPQSPPPPPSSSSELLGLPDGELQDKKELRDLAVRALADSVDERITLQEILDSVAGRQGP